MRAVGFDRVTSLELIPELGVLAGGPNGEVYRADPSELVFESLGRSDMAQDQAHRIEPYEGGFLVAIEGGRLVQYHAESGFCPEFTEILGAGGRRAQEIFVDGPDVLLASFLGRAGVPAVLSWLTPR